MPNFEDAAPIFEGKQETQNKNEKSNPDKQWFYEEEGEGMLEVCAHANGM